MAKLVPNVPYRETMVDREGRITPTWMKWFRDMFERIGGNTALSNVELEDEISGGAVAALQASVTALQAQALIFQTNIDGLNQGPIL